MKRLLMFLFPWYKSKDKYVDQKINDVLALEREYIAKLTTPIYTTIRSFASVDGEKSFWLWAKGLVLTDEYKYLLFILRENTIFESIGVTDAGKVLELNARLNMLAIIDRYLQKGIADHELQVFGVKKSEKGEPGLA